MRIIVASPAKTGNVWIKLLLAQIYNLKVLSQPPKIPVNFLNAFVEAGHFEEDSIFHQHFRPTEAFFAIVEQIDATVVTTIRHPYDVFVSLYYYVQRLPDKFHPQTKLYPLIGKDLDDPAVFNYLEQGEDGFGLEVSIALEWLESHRTNLIRYEDMIADIHKVLTGVTDAIQPVPMDKIEQAVRNNRAEALRKKSRKLNEHIRSATTGDWRNHLTPAHLNAINSAHGTAIERLGYKLHEAPDD